MRRKKGVLTYLLVGLLTLGLLWPGQAALAEPGSDTPSPASTSLFSDVNPDNGNLVYINYINARGIMGGFTDGSFRPDEGLTRAQAAVIISKAANLNLNTAGNSTFSDVNPEHWAFNYINTAVQAGYLQGFGDGSYQPEQPLTRAQAISLLFRLSSEKDSGVPLPALNDMPSDHWVAREMAMAIDAGMISLKGSTINPDHDITRGDMSRALAVLLTSDPGLAARQLYGILKITKGEVKLSRSGQAAVTVSASQQIGTGDTIETLAGASAQIDYPDGSSLLLEPGSIITVKESIGRAYIKHNGQPGTAVDNLQIDLPLGTLFGALSELAVVTAEDEADPTVTAWKKTSRLLAANTDRYDLLAAEEVPWYNTAETKKVKVTVDMPWGVAAIRGTFWQNTVDNNGNGGMSVLQGQALLTSGGQSVTVGSGQATSGIFGSPPSPPAPMPPGQLGQWAGQQGWVQNTFNNMNQNQGAPPPGAPSGGAGTPGNTANLLGQTLNQALNQLQQTLNNLPPTPNSDSGGSNSGGSNNTQITVEADLPDVIYLPTKIMGETGRYPDLVPNMEGITFNLEANVSDTTLNVIGNTHFNFTQRADTQNPYNKKITLIPHQTGQGTDTVTFTLSKQGYRSSNPITVTVHVLPGLRAWCEPGDSMASAGIYTTELDYPESLWEETEEQLTLEMYKADTLENCSSRLTDIGIFTNEASFTIKGPLEAGLYHIIVMRGNTAIAMGSRFIESLEAPEEPFILEKIIVNDGDIHAYWNNNESVDYSVYATITFSFSDDLDLSSLQHTPLQELTTNNPCDDNVKFVYGEGDNSNISILSVPALGQFILETLPELDNEIPATAYLSDNRTIIFELNMSNSIYSIGEITAGVFEPNGSIKKADDSNPDINLDTNPVIPTTANFIGLIRDGDENFFKGTAQSHGIISDLKIRIWGFDFDGEPVFLNNSGDLVYLETGEDGNEEYYWHFPTFTPAASIEWKCPLPTDTNVNDWQSFTQFLHCDVQMTVNDEIFTLINVGNNPVPLS